MNPSPQNRTVTASSSCGWRDHLRDRLEAGDGSVVCWVFSFTTVDVQHCSLPEEPAVLLVPPVTDSPLDHPLHQTKDDFLERRTLLDGERVN